MGLLLILLVPVAAYELTGNIPSPEPHNDAIIDPVIEPSMAIVLDQEVADPQLLAQIQEPNTNYVPYVATSPQPSSPLHSQLIQYEGESAQAVPHKESDPTLEELPHSKQSKTSSAFEVRAVPQQTVTHRPIMEFIDPNWEAIMAKVRRPVQFLWPMK